MTDHAAATESGIVNLACDIHMANHRFTTEEVERIVYALQGMLFDAQRDEPLSAEEMRMPEGERLCCPQEVLTLAGSTEGFRELVNVQREGRLQGERLRVRRDQMAK